MDEKAYDEICQYLLSKQYPTGATKNDKRRIREKSASFVVTENVLYHKGYKGTVQLVVKQVEVHDLWLNSEGTFIINIVTFCILTIIADEWLNKHFH